MSYSNIIFPVNFYQKIYKLSCSGGFIRVNRNSSYILRLVFDSIDYLVLEVGFGKGDFLLQYSIDNPGYQIVGIEKSDRLVKEVSKKLVRNGISNVRLIQASAEFALYFLIPDDSVDEIIINFPDPWPKKAHISRRLVNPNFLKLLNNKMKKGSRIFVSTDVIDYKDFIIDSVKKAVNQGSCFRVTNVFMGFWNEKYQTKYLKKWLKENKKIFSIEIQKI
ncbi:MAG: tRNA (guanosine(46)-N7)-methyltransferase TrmB [Candidatus Calescibacterium sp.]|nr:tRNA (guanosine(46)-N7)-methyltransferase TrmB [Candidatus Calescibacterium sp.]MDW8132266.1 tRNA (guanosine(46)-N7)-methyltransferase TrmB [Candidatus Calescibacterium sp.]